MFLVTTGDERSWKTDERILFLGDWCKLYARKEIWAKLDYTDLPYHWDDRVQLYSDYQYLVGVYERYLIELAGKLNILHGCSHSLRYWRIVIGPWLRYFIDNLYDRYCCLKEAAANEKVTSTWIMKSDPLEWVPLDFNVFYQYLISDQWNHFIYAIIIKKLKLLPYSNINENNSPMNGKNNTKKQPVIKRGLKYCLEQYARIIPNRLNQIVFIDSYFGLADLIRLQISLHQIPYPFGVTINIPLISPQINLREKLKISSAQNEYESILQDMIHLQIPCTYVEAYPMIRDLSLRKYPKNSKAIYTANAYAQNDGFKVWAAESVEKGTKLLIAQHGNFGTGLWEQTENHQLAIGDYYYSWGWKRNNKDNVKRLPAPKLINSKKNIRPNYRGNMLLVLWGVPRYSYLMASFPMASQSRSYINNQITFIESLDEGAINLLKIRLPDSYPGDKRELLKEAGFGDKIDCSNQNFFSLLNQSRLCIATYNGTTFLETFAANYPTLIFWDPEYWELHPDAKPYFDEMRRVGILYDTPQAAAEKINTIYRYPLKWWEQTEVQSIKNNFCEKYAYTNDHWLPKWKAELTSVKNEL